MSFWVWKVWKVREKVQKCEYLENGKSFLEETKNIFHSFWTAIIWWKNKNLIKIADTNFKLFWVLNMSLIIQTSFLLFLLEAATLNLPWIFFTCLVFYLSISRWSVALRCNNVMFESFSEIHQNKPDWLQLSCSDLLIVNLEQVHDWVGSFYHWQTSSKSGWEIFYDGVLSRK